MKGTQKLLLMFLMTLSVFHLNSGAIQPLDEERTICKFEGRKFKSGERISRDHVCHICLCVEGRVECAWMDCPPPPEGCTEMNFKDVCNPSLYLCPIPGPDPRPNYTEVTRAYIRNKRASDIEPSPLETEAEGQAPDCDILGVPYRTGELIGVASHPCLECRCARQSLFCSPRCCFRPAGLHERPEDVLRALRRGWRPIERHPLEHLRHELEHREVAGQPSIWPYRARRKRSNQRQ